MDTAGTIIGIIIIISFFASLIWAILHIGKYLVGRVEKKKNSKKEKKEEKAKSKTEIKKTEKNKQNINGMALTGFILGLVSIIFSWIGIIPILGIIFSSIGISQTTKRNEKGKVLAIIGLILSVIYFIVYLYQYGHLF